MVNQALSWIATLARLGHALRARTEPDTPPVVPLVLYEYEACPMCRRVREALTDLAIPAEIRPCPRRGERFRPDAIAQSGARQFPFLVDPNTDTAMLESDAIVAYLYHQYGSGQVPLWLRGPGFIVTSQIASMARGLAGSTVAASRAPKEPLRLRCNESDPHARLVRERLCELEVAYVRTAGPLELVDSDAGRAMTDRAEILSWVNARFAG